MNKDFSISHFKGKYKENREIKFYNIHVLDQEKKIETMSQFAQTLISLINQTAKNYQHLTLQHLVVFTHHFYLRIWYCLTRSLFFTVI